MAITVHDAEDESRYEIRDGDELAGFAAYERQGDLLAFTHTETLEDFAGRGLGKQLVRDTLDDVRDRGLQILPFCPFVRKLVAEEAAYQELVPAHERERFELPADPEDGR